MTIQPTPGHLKQACGCSLNLHGQSWEQVAGSRGPRVTFNYCPTHAAAPRMLEALGEALMEHKPCDVLDCWCRNATRVYDDARGVDHD